MTSRPLLLLLGTGAALGCNFPMGKLAAAQGQLAWLLLAALVPVSLGLGNVYRTLAWPRGAGPMRLAVLTSLAAAGPLLTLAWALDGLDLPALLAVPGLVSLQLLASSLMFLMFFRLQQEGGPTYLSQIGYVAAAVGAGIGVGVLGESYPAAVWAGVAIIAAGIGLTTLTQLRTARA